VKSSLCVIGQIYKIYLNKKGSVIKPTPFKQTYRETNLQRIGYIFKHIAYIFQSIR